MFSFLDVLGLGWVETAFVGTRMNGNERLKYLKILEHL